MFINKPKIFRLTAMFPPMAAACVLLLFVTATQATTTTQAKADTAIFDGKKGEVTYSGSASLFNENVRIDADEMVTEQNDNGDIKRAKLSGHPARLSHVDPKTGAHSTAEAEIILYEPLTGRIELSGHAHLRQDDTRQDAHTEVDANQIQLLERSNLLSSMDASGLPAKFTRHSGSNPPYLGEASTMSYRANGETLELKGTARLTRGNTTLEHEIIYYDGVNKTTTAPKLDGQQVHFTKSPDATEHSPETP